MSQLVDNSDADYIDETDNGEPSGSQAPEKTDAGSSRNAKSKQRARQLPSRDEILQRLDALPRMLLAGAITSAEANSMRSVLDSQLRAMERSTGNGAGPIDLNKWKDVVRAFPAVADDVARFFSDANVDSLFGGE